MTVVTTIVTIMTAVVTTIATAVVVTVAVVTTLVTAAIAAVTVVMPALDGADLHGNLDDAADQVTVDPLPGEYLTVGRAAGALGLGVAGEGQEVVTLSLLPRTLIRLAVPPVLLVVPALPVMPARLTHRLGAGSRGGDGNRSSHAAGGDENLASSVHSLLSSSRFPLPYQDVPCFAPLPEGNLRTVSGSPQDVTFTGW